MELVGAIAAGFVLDMILGDPRFGTVHPVVVIGWFITAVEEAIWRVIYHCDYKTVRRRMIRSKRLKARRQKTRRQNPKLYRKAEFRRKKGAEKAVGFVMTFLIVAGTWIVTWQILAFAAMIHPAVRVVVEAFLIYKILAAKSLKKETMRVYTRLKRKDLRGARRKLSYLVGRDTKELSESEVIQAGVETIAENTADGIVAPLFYIALGGAPLGLAYKAVNTLDSMVGYRNARYRYIGFASARLDDICNLIPARLAALLMILASGILRLDLRNAVRIFKRDRYRHLSPNSAQTESVAAGALGIRLGGTHTYFGKEVRKPTIGDPLRPANCEDIRRANRLMYVTAVLALLVCLLLAALIHVVIL